jgi:ABC-type sugar transport system substrate-binding protein
MAELPSDNSINLNTTQGKKGTDRRNFLKRAGVVGTGAFASTAALAACGSKSKSLDSQIGSTASAATAKTANLSASLKGKTIGLAFLTLADPNVQVIRASLEEAAKRANLNWTFTQFDGQGKPDQAQKGLQSLISKGVDLIYLEGIAPRLVKEELARAKAANIPVIGGFTAAPLDEGIMFDYAAILESDSVVLNEYMLTELNTIHADKAEIKIALVDSDLDVILGRTKVLEGLLQLAVNKKVKVVGAQNIDLADPVGSSTKIAASFLTKNPDLDAIWTNYPNSGIAAANAVSQKKMVDQVKVYGHIANAAGIEALRDKTSPMSATSWIDLVYTSYGTVGFMLDVFSKKPVARTVAYTNPVPVTVLARPTIADQIPGDGTTWVFSNGTYRDGFVNTWAEKYSG